LAVARDGHVEVLESEHHLEHRPDGLFVIDDQDTHGDPS
jgi:hypothetical protein